MRTETNRRTVEAFLAEPTGVVLTEDVVVQDHAQGRIFRGRGQVAALFRDFYADGFPAARLDAPVIVADEVAAVLEFTFRGRQCGSFMGIPPTSREVAVPMTIVFRLDEGQIRSANIYYDAGTLLRQLGLARAVGQ